MAWAIVGPRTMEHLELNLPAAGPTRRPKCWSASTRSSTPGVTVNANDTRAHELTTDTRRPWPTGSGLVAVLVAVAV